MISVKETIKWHQAMKERQLKLIDENVKYLLFIDPNRTLFFIKLPNTKKLLPETKAALEDAGWEVESKTFVAQKEGDYSTTVVLSVPLNNTNHN